MVVYIYSYIITLRTDIRSGAQHNVEVFLLRNFQKLNHIGYAFPVVNAIVRIV